MTPPKRTRRFKISPFEVTLHQFNKVLRLIERDTTRREILENLAAQRRAVMRNITKGMGFAILATLWVATNSPKSVLDFKMLGFDLHIPAVYVTFVVSLALVGITLMTIESVFFGQFIRIATERLHRVRRAPDIDLMLDDGGQVWSNGLLSSLGMFKTTGNLREISRMIVFVLFAVPVLIVMVVIFSTCIETALFVLQADESSFVSRCIALSSLSLLAFPVAIVPIISLPSEVEPNPRYIRYIFVNKDRRRGMGLYLLSLRLRK